MIVIRRRLFWKIYATLLCSLVTVAVLMGCLWWLLGDVPREHWGTFHIHLAEPVLPGPDAKPGVLAEAVRRLGVEMGADISVYDRGGALIASDGEPIALRAGGPDAVRGSHHLTRIDLADGRSVLARQHMPPGEPGLRILTAMLVVAAGVGLAAFPMTTRLTRQFESLRSGMASWGGGALSTRVDDSGTDEVAAVARSFNMAAAQVERLLASQRALLANASHELRSPLARLRIAIELWLHEPAPTTHAEIVRNLVEVDQLVEEILLSSRLDHASAYVGRSEAVDLLGLAAEEAARVGATASGAALVVEGNARLLRRLLRNLLENARSHGQPPVEVEVSREEHGLRVSVSDRGPGIAVEERERVFEPFYRPAGRGEAGGGWGLGLSLVRQIAARHGGSVECDEAPGGGTRFVVHLAKTTAGDIVGSPVADIALRSKAHRERPEERFLRAALADTPRE